MVESRLRGARSKNLDLVVTIDPLSIRLLSVEEGGQQCLVMGRLSQCTSAVGAIAIGSHWANP